MNQKIQITLQNVGRRFNSEHIFSGINYTFTTKQSYAILGPNGSGKSTLLRLLSGILSPSSGSIRYLDNDQELHTASIYQYLSMVAPFIDLIENFSLQEMIHFHFKFKKYHPKANADELLQVLSLGNARHKPIRNFSSGMKQRVKLALACCSSSPILLLDEPCTNLDPDGVAWYQELVQIYAPEKLLVVASNQQQEHAFCKHQMLLSTYKKVV